MVSERNAASGDRYWFVHPPETAEWREIPDMDWYSNELPKQTCELGHPLPHKYPRPIDVYLVRPPRVANVLAGGKGPELVRADLWKYLEPSLTTQAVGKCYIKSGTRFVESKDFVTVYDHPGHHIRMYGGPTSKYMECEECSFATDWIRGKGYFLRRQIAGRAWMHCGVTITISDELERALPWPKLSGLRRNGFAVKF
jgi:hypothetical protein